jgi:hypothetical protein
VFTARCLNTVGSEVALKADVERHRILVVDPGEKIEKPLKFWRRWNQRTSPENVRFLIEVQRVTTPAMRTLKFGSQE